MVCVGIAAFRQCGTVLGRRGDQRFIDAVKSGECPLRFCELVKSGRDRGILLLIGIFSGRLSLENLAFSPRTFLPRLASGQSSSQVGIGSTDPRECVGRTAVF